MKDFFFKQGIHPTARIDEGAKIGENVSIGAYSIIGSGVVLQDNAKISDHVVVSGRTTIASNAQIYPFNVLGAPAQDLKYPDYEGKLWIGENTVVREHTSIHAGTPESEEQTVIGNDCYIMAATHIGHDCHIGNHVIVASVGISGHVQIEDHVVLGARAGFHQFLRIGRFAMTAGVSAFTRDVPPFAISENERPNEFSGLNVIGLKRNGFKKSDIQEIREIYKYLYSLKGKIKDRVEPVLEKFPQNSYAQEITNFIKKSKMNLCTPPMR